MAGQVLILQEYLSKVRPLLLQLKGQDNEGLLMTIGESMQIKDAVQEFLLELQKKYPFLKSFRQVRNSVIYHWVKEKNLREAQYLAGHGSIHSTQRYKQANLDDLQLQLDLYHPLR
jgi:integrase/recombinase XerD